MSELRGTDAHDAIVQSYQVPDAHSYGVYTVLENISKSLAIKITEGNAFMKRLVYSGLNPMNILSYPICGRCETIALWDDYAIKDGKPVKKCHCTKEGCWSETLDPITLAEWVYDELKKKAPDNIKEILDAAFDETCMRLFAIAQAKVEKAIAKTEAESNEGMGIVMPDGSMHPTNAYASYSNSPIFIDKTKGGKEDV